MTARSPFSSREVRWFIEGSLQENDGLLRWFHSAEPFARQGDVPAPALEGRLDDAPDVYLLLPGHTDMGIKWREGMLQIKGRVASVGSASYRSRHEGIVERWIKWSYADLPEHYRALFQSGQQRHPVSVSKRRAVRLVDLQQGVAGAMEVDQKTWLDCGIAAEITDLEVGKEKYCTLGFEAFPDSAISREVFDGAVTAFLDALGEPVLRAGQSMSYPAWLQHFL